MPVEVIDAHTHVVSADVGRYPIAPGVGEEQSWHRNHPVDTEGLLALAEAAGVRALALVQALSCHGYDSRYVLDSARAHPGRTVAIGAVRPGDPLAVASLRRDVVEGGARGVRVFAVGGETAPLDHPDVRAIAATAGDLDIPVVLLIVAAQLPSVLELVNAYPAVRFVLDHCGFADLGGDASFDRAAQLIRACRAGQSSSQGVVDDVAQHRASRSTVVDTRRTLRVRTHDVGLRLSAYPRAELRRARRTCPRIPQPD